MASQFKTLKTEIDLRKIKNQTPKAPELIVGDQYFVSFSGKTVHPCKLIKINTEFERVSIDVEIELKDKLKSTEKTSLTYTLFTTEIGKTPVEAIINQSVKGM
ncbi:hypothetical protein AWW67_09520 [Roseivirga seohaensis]|uniref:Uncharacterized protein n=1 Tax=Roseivirga seohaensis TaxID=1914963 RepID=A0A150XNR4_9BACT|nr:hypothetical protein [Roseivirga seohaensis]KYG80407.1 hypothetical protein AWW67_09520 [Roseivirga seohaensis]